MINRTASPQGARPAVRFAVCNIGFRPFYLLAAAFAAIAIACWVGQLAGWTGAYVLVAGPLWHAHEMMFGYAFAVLTGFLFTAVRNWADKPTPAGWTLALIVALWLAGRVLVLTPWPFYAATTDTAFALAAAAGIGIPLFRSRSRRNYFFVALIIGFGAGNLCFYLAMAGWIDVAAERALHFGLDLLLLLMVVMGGRLIPMFTANAVPGASPASVRWIDRLAIGGVLALLAADLMKLPPVAMAITGGLAAIANSVRLVLWQPWHTMRRPMLWILHASYGWIAVHLTLRVLASMALMPISLAIHALTIGAIGGLTAGMMARTSRGHTGRQLIAGKWEIACFMFIQIAAIVRVFVPVWWPEGYLVAVLVSGVLWTAAFVLLAFTLGPMLLNARVDGRAG